MLAIPSTQAF